MDFLQRKIPVVCAVEHPATRNYVTEVFQNVPELVIVRDTAKLEAITALAQEIGPVVLLVDAGFCRRYSDDQVRELTRAANRISSSSLRTVSSTEWRLCSVTIPDSGGTIIF